MLCGIILDLVSLRPRHGLAWGLRSNAQVEPRLTFVPEDRERPLDCGPASALRVERSSDRARRLVDQGAVARVQRKTQHNAYADSGAVFLLARAERHMEIIAQEKGNA